MAVVSSDFLTALLTNFRTLFERAGFRLTRIVRTESNMKIIEGEPT